jgi:hypothetical protein
MKFIQQLSAKCWVWEMPKLSSISCTRFETNYSSCTGKGSEKKFIYIYIYIYRAVVKALMKNERQDETQFTTKIVSRCPDTFWCCPLLLASSGSGPVMYILCLEQDPKSVKGSTKMCLGMIHLFWEIRCYKAKGR